MAAPHHHTFSAIAQTGFAKGASYDQHRPSYPPEAVESILQAAHVAGQPQATIVDLAAGTGKFTVLLDARDEQFEVLAVEPHEGMRKELERKELRKVTVKDGLSTSIPAADESVDAVVVAQAFHWFANEESLKEIHRILKPSGTLAMVWNVEDYNAPQADSPTTSWEGKVKALTWTFDDGQMRYRHGRWREVFDRQLKATPLTISAANPLFSLPLGEDQQDWTVWLTKEALWQRYRTLSQIAILEGEELEKAHATFTDAVTSADVETNDKGEIAVHGSTRWAWTGKVPV
ncbi:methyltransferase [Aulographum hederae CBS 113979]|uniref:Methyltransferase n=1 Tax=Aulographum hederae CBS 113979 TaxID=1176131 RepID=A0A6G1GV81_9PEZI|nr:methyltransferase [Aulographum hederae CBS 113979]